MLYKILSTYQSLRTKKSITEELEARANGRLIRKKKNKSRDSETKSQSVKKDLLFLTLDAIRISPINCNLIEQNFF